MATAPVAFLTATVVARRDRFGMASRLALTLSSMELCFALALLLFTILGWLFA